MVLTMFSREFYHLLNYREYLDFFVHKNESNWPSSYGQTIESGPGSDAVSVQARVTFRKLFGTKIRAKILSQITINVCRGLNNMVSNLNPLGRVIV